MGNCKTKGLRGGAASVTVLAPKPNLIVSGKGARLGGRGLASVWCLCLSRGLPISRGFRFVQAQPPHTHRVKPGS